MTFNLSLLFDMPLHCGLAWTDTAGALVYVNPYWHTLFEQDSVKLGEQIDLSSLSLPLGFHQMMRQISEKKSSTQFQVCTTHKQKTSHWWLTVQPVFTDEAITGVLFVMEENKATSISTQKLESRMEDRTNKLQAVFDVIAVATEAHEKDLSTVLQGCLEQVIDSTYASGGAIQLLDRDGEVLLLQAHAGLEVEIVTEMRESSAETGLFGWTASHQEKLVLPDLMSDWRTSEVIRNSDVNAYAGVPMNAEGALVGVLSIFREKKRAFSTDDISVLASIADQIGVIIANHRLRAENNRLMLIEERNRLARELHDAVTQSLYSSMLLTEALKGQAHKGNLNSVVQISEQLQSNAHQALKEMRLLIHNLRPSILSSVGLIRAIRHRLKAVEERAGIKHQLSVTGQINVPSQIEETLYFVTQEALNNSLKHALANQIDVMIEQKNDLISIKIIDDGCGFEVDTLDEGGLGLISMQERIHQINGEIFVTSQPDQGTTVEIAWEERP